MTSFFYSLGFVILVIGAGWCFLIASQPSALAGNAGLEIITKVLAMSPGFGIAGAGLLFLAIGGVLHRLDKIVDNGRPLAVARAPAPRGPVRNLEDRILGPRDTGR